MELLKKSESVVTEMVWTLQDETSVFYYKEWISDGKVIDFIMRDKDGHEIDDAALLEKVQEFIA